MAEGLFSVKGRVACVTGASSGLGRRAALVLAPVVQAEFRLCATLDVTGRGTGGFGSTGRR